MKFLPSENIIYKSNLSENKILERLSLSVENETSGIFDFGNKVYSKSYLGTITGNRFKMQRAINYRNSFLPNITGEIKNENDGTRISVLFRLSGFVVTFLKIWSFGVIICGLALLYISITQKLSLFLFTIPLMLIFPILLTFVFFNPESKRSKSDLKEIFSAEIISEE